LSGQDGGFFFIEQGKQRDVFQRFGIASHAAPRLVSTNPA